MKFTNGFWQMKKEIEPLYAIEYYSHRIEGDSLVVYAPSKHLETRGDTLNLGMLTVRFSSPMDDVIKVSITHFEGVVDKGPYFEIFPQKANVCIDQTDEWLIYQSGKTKAMISKRPNDWQVKFMSEDMELTNSAFRNMAYMTNTQTDTHYMVEQLAIDVGEYIYGLGERFTPFIKNGQTIEMWNEDGGTASEIAYKNIPFYITNKGYGVLLNHEEDVAYEIGSEKVERVQFSVKGEKLEYYFINGQTPKGTIEKYTSLTGKPALPPAWSFGLWLTTSFTTNYDEETTNHFITGMKERNIPLHVFHFDCFWMEGFEWCNFTWDKHTFPDPQGMIERYKQRGLKICVWINPYIAQKSPLFKEGMGKGYLLKKKNGDVWQTDMWQAGMGLVDFTNKEATDWYLGYLKNLLDMGVDCFKTDFGERIPVKDIAYADGSDPIKMHNYYTHLFNQAVFKLLEREKGVNEAVVFARSASVGGQQYPVHWGGDCSATYPSMAETLRSGLSLSLAGFGFWSHDISGFEATAPSDIYKRWCQFGLLSSHSRLHGSSSYRVPWLFDEEACDVLRQFINLKCTLMPYLYNQAVKTSKTGIPMMRPMFVQFPKDRTCETLDRQYMLGDALLVAPIFKESGEVEYYVPQGTWYNLLTKQTIQGEKWYKETFDYFSLPLLVAPNQILVFGNNTQHTEYHYVDNMHICLSYFEDGQEAIVTVPDLSGAVEATVRAIRKGQILELKVESEYPFTYELLGDQDVEIQLKK